MEGSTSGRKSIFRGISETLSYRTFMLLAHRRQNSVSEIAA